MPEIIHFLSPGDHFRVLVKGVILTYFVEPDGTIISMEYDLRPKVAEQAS